MGKIFKSLGLLLVLVGLVILFLEGAQGSEVPLLVGLFILFVTREASEDERVKNLKTSSAFIALIIGYAFKLITTNLYNHQAISFQLVDINYFLILVFALATCIYYLRFYLSWK